MPRLIWSPAALRDVQRLHRFLVPKSVDAARRAIIAIRQGLKVLDAQPGVGRPVDSMAPEFREWPIAFGDSGYLVMYRWDGDTVIVVAVRHQREAGYH